MLHSCSSTLQTLDVPFYVAPRHKSEEQFWTLRFPRLRKLSLFGWGCELFSEPPDRKKFFEDHVNTLEEISLEDYEQLGSLSLSFGKRVIGRMEDGRMAEALGIRTLKACPEQLSHLVDQYTPFMRDSLERVTILVARDTAGCIEGSGTRNLLSMVGLSLRSSRLQELGVLLPFPPIQVGLDDVLKYVGKVSTPDNLMHLCKL